MYKNKIRIIHIVQSPGGVKRYLKSFFKYIDYNRFENILLCSYDYSKDEFLDIIDDFENVEMVRSISPLKDIKSIIKIRKLLNKYKPDIIYCHSSKGGALSRIANIGLGSKCVYNPHGWAFNMKENKIKQLMYVFIEKILSYFCDGIVCISKAEEKSAYQKKICSQNKLHVICNGIDLDEYQMENLIISRNNIGIPEDAFVIGTVGRISEQKSPDIFVKAAKIIKQKIPEAYFLMVGDGDQRDKIEECIIKFNLENSFYITGWVNNPMDYIKLFDVATLLSRWEGFGLVLPEYMLAQKPIIATNVDAIPFIINNRRNGLLVAEDDFEGVYHGVLELFQNQNLSRELVNKGYKDVLSQFNIERVVREHENLFEDLIK